MSALAAAIPQFGEHPEGVVFRDRPCAFGLIPCDGKLACVRVDKPDRTVFHLPGGALDPGEDEAAAMVREVLEETGLRVAVGELVARANQYIPEAEQGPVNNRSVFFAATVEGEDPHGKVEDDHTLVWLPPAEAIRAVRNDAHAWALAAWMRRAPGT